MARDFPGSGANRLNVGDVSAIDITGTALTISLWAYLDTVAGGVYRDLVGKAQGGSLATIQYELRITSGGKLEFYTGNGSTATATLTAANGPTGAWAHIVARQSGTGADALRIYVNNTLAASGSTSISIANLGHSLMFGSRVDNDGTVDGRMAHIGIWNAALTTEEIEALSKGLPPSRIRPTNLKGYWPLLGLSSPEPDMSGNANSASIVGTVAASSESPVNTPMIVMPGGGI